MNTMNANNQPRSFGYWIKAADRFRSVALREALETAGASLREWQILRRVDGSISDSNSVETSYSALTTHSTSHPMRGRKLGKMIARGWIMKQGDAWALTNEGRELKNHLDLVAEGLQAQVSEAISAEDLETTQKTLEQIARIFGWEEGASLPKLEGRRHRGRRGHGYGHDTHFGHGKRFGREHHSGYGERFGRDDDFARGERRGRNEHGGRGERFGRGEHFGYGERLGREGSGHRGGGRGDQRLKRLAGMLHDSYERGFDAGLNRDHNA